jgi:hypothetical protein
MQQTDGLLLSTRRLEPLQRDGHEIKGFNSIVLYIYSNYQIYVRTDDQSASLSWCQAPSGAQDQIFVAVNTVAGL